MTKKGWPVALLMIGGVAVIGLGLYFLAASFYRAPKPAITTLSPVPSAHKLDHVVLILEENKSKDSIIGNSSAPYINSLAKNGSLATNYTDVAKPSLPNYLALTSGTFNKIRRDCNPSAGCQVKTSNIADALEDANKTWREYAESMPDPCTTHNAADYAVRHNPFMYFPDITSNKLRCDQHVVNFVQLSQDFSDAKTTPVYSFVTPNLCNDMHNCSIATGDKWLRAHVPTILNSPAFKTKNSLLVITWDEGSTFNHHISAIFAGPAARSGYVSHQHYDHYALLHTIEVNLGLKPLNQQEQHSPLMNDMLRR